MFEDLLLEEKRKIRTRGENEPMTEITTTTTTTTTTRLLFRLAVAITFFVDGCCSQGSGGNSVTQTYDCKRDYGSPFSLMHSLPRKKWPGSLWVLAFQSSRAPSC